MGGLLVGLLQTRRTQPAPNNKSQFTHISHFASSLCSRLGRLSILGFLSSYFSIILLSGRWSVRLLRRRRCCSYQPGVFPIVMLLFLYHVVTTVCAFVDVLVLHLVRDFNYLFMVYQFRSYKWFTNVNF